MTNENQFFFKFFFSFFFNPRCLLIDLVYWVKRELKTIKKKSSLVLIHLTPFAWRSGQTSSMLGGAQFKATLLTVKHLPAIYNAKWQIILVTKQENGKQLSVAWKLTALRGRPFLQVYVSRWAEGNTQKYRRWSTESKPQNCWSYQSWYWLIFWNANPCFIHTLLKDTAAQSYPHTARQILCPLLQSLKSFSNF